MSAKVDKYRQRAAESNRDLPHPVYAAMVEHCDEPAISYDFYPTFVDLAGGQLPTGQTIDGLEIDGTALVHVLSCLFRSQLDT